MKIVVKLNKSLQNHLELLKQQYQIVCKQQDSSKIMEFELKPKVLENRFCISEMLFERYKRKTFFTLHTISKCKRSYVKPRQPAESTTKPNIHGAKVMLCIWLEQKGYIYYELLKSGQNITGNLYRTQLIRLKRTLAENPTEYAARYEIC